jgi:phosphoglycerate dehydrogenase-like enzyme
MISAAGLSFNEVQYGDSDDCFVEAFARAQAVLFAPGRFLADEIFQKSQHLKLMQIWSSGFDKFNTIAAKRYNIPVSNNGGANSIAVAEHAIMLMLAVYKRLPEMHQRVVTGNWTGNDHGMSMFLVHGKTLGIIGLGAIGLQVAIRARAMGMKVIYNDINRKFSAEQSFGFEFCDLEILLARSNIISLHLHLSDSSRRLLGKHEFDLMKPGSVLINVSRGELVDNSELLIRLNSGQLRGVGLDVFEVEPTTAGDPLTNHANAVCTPHSANTIDTHRMALEASLANIRQVLSGGQPNWLIP